MKAEFMLVFGVLFAACAFAFYMLGHRVGKKEGLKEGKEKANKAVISRAKKLGYNMTEIYTKLIR